MTRGTIKAIELLNENLYVKLFHQNVVPHEDILFPYRIYFQFLKTPISLNLNDNDFWTCCCNYFINESYGKAGKILFFKLR